LLSQLLALGLAPVLFRLYTPRDFGVWAAVQAMAITAGSLVSLRFDLALVLERNPAAASKLLYTIIGVVIACSIIVGFLIGVSIGFLRLLGIDATTAFLGWSWLVLLGFGVVLQSWLMREAAFGSISVAVVLNAFVTNIVQLAGAISGDGIWLIIGSIAGQAAALIFYVTKIMSEAERPVWLSLTFNEITALLVQHRRFPQFSLPFTVVSLLRDRAPILMIGAFRAGRALQPSLAPHAFPLDEKFAWCDTRRTGTAPKRVASRGYQSSLRPCSTAANLKL